MDTCMRKGESYYNKNSNSNNNNEEPPIYAHIHHDVVEKCGLSGLVDIKPLELFFQHRRHTTFHQIR